MPLTSAQRATLKTHIQGNSDTNTLYVAGNLQGLADLLNLTASPDFWVWRTRVTRDEFVGATSVDGTVFAWAGTGYITRAQGERDLFNAIFDSTFAVNPSQANVRQAFTDAFSGATAPAPANRTHLATIARRKATRLEKVFTTGTGSTATPGFLVVEYAAQVNGSQTYAGTFPYTELVGL